MRRLLRRYGSRPRRGLTLISDRDIVAWFYRKSKCFFRKNQIILVANICVSLGKEWKISVNHAMIMAEEKIRKEAAMMKVRRLFSLLTALALVLLTTGCSIRENVPQPVTPQTQTTLSKKLSYYYGFTKEVPLTLEAAQLLDDFGQPISFWPAEPKTELFTEIPEVENNAKGLDPITIVLPDLDLTKYSGPYFTDDYELGLEVSTYYRVVANLVTDECVKIYFDSDGRIIQYETQNLGKYDELNLNETSLTDRKLKFEDAIRSALSSVTLDFFLREPIQGPSAYALFTNNADRLVITTTTPLTAECSLNQSNIWVDLYAVIT